jgi:predicted acetyltransferase
MPPELVYRPITDDEPLAPIARLAGLAFGYSNDDTVPWFEDRVGRQNIRIVTRPDDPAPLGVLGRIPMGIHLAGNEVPQLGVLAVGVAPEARGMGVARRMMAHAVREMHADRSPLSVLYSAMHPLYRAVGYENAGLLCDAAIPAGMIEPPDTATAPGWREATDADTPGIIACDTAYARATHGSLARVEYLWHRIREPKSGFTRCFVAPDNDGAVEAYCYYSQEKTESTTITTGNAAGAAMRVTALAWSTPRGFDRVRSFLRGFSSVVGEIHVSLPPDSPLLHTLPDRRFALTVREPWMLRVLNIKTALESRGYPRGLNATLALDITDDQIDANTGAWTLTLADGRAAVEPRIPDTPPDALRIHIRDLAPLYTGFTSARTLRAAGRLDATDETADTADALFATPSTPAMVDMF